MSLFLRSRSSEVVDGGKMVLFFLGRAETNHDDRGVLLIYELLARSLAFLVSEGEVEEEKLESYNINLYAPSKEEFEEEVRRDGCFEIERLEMFDIDRDINMETENGSSYGIAMASLLRAVHESTIKHHFGDKIVDSLFELYARLVDEEMSKEEIRPFIFVVALRKIC